jgi:hypothetical protein
MLPTTRNPTVTDIDPSAPPRLTPLGDTPEERSPQVPPPPGPGATPVGDAAPAGADGAQPREEAPPRPAGERSDTLTLGEASRLHRVSESTLRRRLANGALPGARKIPGPRGEEWHVPVAELEALGYRRVQPRESRPAAAAPAPAVPRVPSPRRDDAISETVAILSEALAEEQRRLLAMEQIRDDIERERQDAVLRSARAEALLEAERHGAERAAERVLALEERLERVTEERDRYAQALGWSGRRRLRREDRVSQLQADERDRFRRTFARED